MEAISLPRNNSNDIATAQFRLNLSDLAFWNFGERLRGNIRFHPPERTEKRTVGSKISIMSPASAHLARGMRDTAPAEIARQIFYQTAPIIIVQPVFQIMKSRKIFAGALAAAITVQLDIMQEALRSPIRLRLVQHSGKAERDLKKSPAIHALKIYRGRLDPIVDFKREMLIACSHQCLSDCRSTFTNRQSLPISCFGFCNEPVELILPLKNCAKWQPRLGCQRG